MSFTWSPLAGAPALLGASTVEGTLSVTLDALTVSATGAVLSGAPADAVGPAGVATLATAVESGATVTYEWLTDVLTSISGKEQRLAILRRPRQRFEFTSVLDDAQQRAALAALVGNAADAATFLLALAHEDLTVASSSAASITVHSLALCDWAVAGQRIVVVSPSGANAEAHITAAPAGATIPVSADLTAVAVEGARVMPALAVYLDADQALARHRVNLGEWSLAARAALLGYGATATWGAGATVTTHDGLPVWDRGVAHDRADQPLMSGAELVDLGGRLAQLASYDVPSWGRAVRIERSSRAEWQWFKAFLDEIKGRFAAWLLPTGRPDLVPVGDASTGTLTISGTDYVAKWWPSLAHRWLKLVAADGSIAYRTITAASDNGDGTQDLALSAAFAGAIARVEFLELVRLASDTVTVTWRGASFESSLTATVVQDADVQTRRPVERYTFTLPSGTYTLTSSDEDEIDGATTFTSTALSRSNISVTQLGKPRELTVSLPLDHALVQALLANGIPPREVTLTIDRVDAPGDPAVQIWSGYVVEVSTDGPVARLRVPAAVDVAFDVTVPILRASRMCQHQLYGTGCGLDRATFAIGCAVSSISADGTQITLSTVGPYTGEQLKHGDVRRTSDGERRTILAQTGTTITVDVPFATLAVLDGLTVAPGCDWTPTTCRDTFANIANFGGHPELPAVNPTAPQHPKGDRGIWDRIFNLR